MFVADRNTTTKYFEGTRVPVCMACRLERKAEVQDSAPTFVRCGVCYFKGDGIPGLFLFLQTGIWLIVSKQF